MSRPRTSRLLLASALASPLAWAGAPARAQPAAEAPPAGGLTQAEILGAAADAVHDAGPAWTLSVNLRRAMQSPLAGSLLAASEAAGQPLDLAAFLEETGLDARSDVGGVVLSGMSLDGGDATLVADLGDSAGRLAGWFAEQEGHGVQTLADGSDLHHFTMRNQAAGGEPAPVWASLRDTDAGVRLVASTTEAGALELTDDRDLEDRLAPAPDLGAPDRIFSFRVPEVPEGLVPEGTMGQQALEAIRGVAFAIDSGEELGFDLRLDTADQAGATQLQQVLQGFAGMVPMMAPGLGLPPEQTQALAEAMRSMDIASEPADANAMPGVRLRLGIPQETVDAMMQGPAGAGG